jgi:hypothetical protein
VEDASLLRLTPLIVFVKTGSRESNSYTKFLYSDKLLKRKEFPQKFLIPSLEISKGVPAFCETDEVGHPHSKDLQAD